MLVPPAVTLDAVNEHHASARRRYGNIVPIAPAIAVARAVGFDPAGRVSQGVAPCGSSPAPTPLHRASRLGRGAPAPAPSRPNQKSCSLSPAPRAPDGNHTI